MLWQEGRKLRKLRKLWKAGNSAPRFTAPYLSLRLPIVLPYSGFPFIRTTMPRTPRILALRNMSILEGKRDSLGNLSFCPEQGNGYLRFSSGLALAGVGGGVCRTQQKINAADCGKGRGVPPYGREHGVLAVLGPWARSWVLASGSWLLGPLAALSFWLTAPRHASAAVY